MEALRPTPVLVLAVIALAGCASHGVDEAAYARANGIVVRSVPRLPASRLVNSYSLARGPGAPVRRTQASQLGLDADHLVVE